MNEGTSPVQTTENSGVSVTKTVDGDESGATVTLDVTSRLDEPAVVQLVDPAVESIDDERIEIETGGARERSDGESPEFERELGSGESWSIVYRVADAAPEQLDQTPEVSLSDDDGIEALLDRSRSGMLRNFVSGDRESLTGASADETAERGDAADTVEAGVETRDETQSEPVESVPETAGETPEAVASTLLNELRNGDIDRETRAALREELEPRRSREVRLKHLQQQVSDLVAYTDMLEVFIDEYGPLEETYGGLDSELRAVRGEQADLLTQVEELDSEMDRVNDRLDQLEEFRDSLSGVFRDLGDSDE